MRVVISNRDKYARKEIVRYLCEQYPNCDTESYSDCLLAAKSVYTKSTDVIIVGIDGIKLIPMLRKKEAGLVVIVLADNYLHRDEAFSSGADAYLSLPLSREKLFDAVEGRQSMDIPT
ncbi:MAG: hypothetical protein J6N76_10465 [Lachnospiraceae bacterium]|nr:hypothetical protein [Lachnospiraceae bacterium]